MDGDTGFRGMVDVHSHFRALFAADLVIGEFKTRLLTALYETKTLFFIFPEIIVRQPEKKMLWALFWQNSLNSARRAGKSSSLHTGSPFTTMVSPTVP